MLELDKEIIEMALTHGRFCHCILCTARHSGASAEGYHEFERETVQRLIPRKKPRAFEPSSVDVVAPHVHPITFDTVTQESVIRDRVKKTILALKKL